MLLNGICVLNNDRFLEPCMTTPLFNRPVDGRRSVNADGFGFSYLQSGASSMGVKSNVIHAIKWFQVMRSAPTCHIIC